MYTPIKHTLLYIKWIFPRWILHGFINVMDLFSLSSTFLKRLFLVKGWYITINFLPGLMLRQQQFKNSTNVKQTLTRKSSVLMALVFRWKDLYPTWVHVWYPRPRIQSMLVYRALQNPHIQILNALLFFCDYCQTCVKGSLKNQS